MSVDKGKTQHYRKLIERRHILTSFKQFVLHTLKMALCFTTIGSLYTTQVLAKEERYKVIQPLIMTASGTFGRLRVGNYTSILYNECSQAAVDAPDSAACWNTTDGYTIIGDHGDQGFRVLLGLGAGATATIETDSCIEYLTMASRYQGYNTGEQLVLLNGQSAYDVHDGNILMYTCNVGSTGYSVTVTYWNVTGTGPLPSIPPHVPTQVPTQAQVYTKSDAQIQAEKQAEIEAQQQAEEEARKAEDARIAEEKKAEAEQSLALHSYVETTECESNEEVMESIRETEQAELDKKAEQKQKLTNDIAIGVAIVASCVGLILACI